MATNEILPFTPTDTGTNLLTQVVYAASTQRDIGNQPGIASSKLNNKAIRQATFIAASLAQYISDKTGDNVLDDSNDAALLVTMQKAWQFARIQAVTGTDTALSTSDIIELQNTTSYTLTLPAANTVTGKVFTLKKTAASGTNTISPAVDGTTLTLDSQYQTVRVYSNGVSYGIC